MQHEYITDKKSITTSLSDALEHCYKLHEDGNEITNVHIDLEKGKIIVTVKNSFEVEMHNPDDKE